MPTEFPFPAPCPLDPPEHYAGLRQTDPVPVVTLPSGDHARIAIRYDDVRRVYADPRFSRAATLRPGAPQFAQVSLSPASIGSMDPPEHTRLRRLLAPAFSARRMEAYRPRARRIAADLLTRVRATEPPADLVAGFTRPLPIMMICELLGVPVADQERFRAWGAAAVDITLQGSGAATEGRRRLTAYLAELIAAKRADPADDVLGTLISASDEDRLSDDELADLGMTLLLAGYETTANQLAGSVVLLLRDAERLPRLRSRPDLVPRAVEELLRFLPLAVLGFMRVATEDVELGGTVVRSGEAVIPLPSAANRDPGVFDDPDTVQLTREKNPHIAFGYGAHHCVGAQLARIELQASLTALADAFPRLRLAVPEEKLNWRTGLAMVSLTELPVTW